jgi:hypothetical protein
LFVQGYWVANAEGLWKVAGMNASDGPIPWQYATKILAAAPVTFRHETDNEQGAEIDAVVRRNGAWCGARWGWGGDESGTMFCLNGDGIVAGRKYSYAGETSEVRFCVAEQDCKPLPN